VAQSSARVLTLLSLLEARQEWQAEALAGRLEITTRTLRRDIETLRDLGYPIDSVRGPGGGYRLGAGSKLPPLVLDDDQAIAIALALQTAPASIAGMDESLARALTTLRQVMPARLRTTTDDLQVTALRNYWEFSAPPISASTLRAVGSALRNRQILAIDYEPVDAGHASPPRQVEPYHVLVWAGRWYLVCFDLGVQAWRILRIERIRPRTHPGPSFTPRPLPQDDIVAYVTHNADRGDTPAHWQCLGSAVIDLPASVAAQWAPGGSVVEPVDATRCRLTLGGWSWAGVAGLYATFDADLSDVEPEQLRDAFAALSQRAREASAQMPRTPAGLLP